MLNPPMVNALTEYGDKMITGGDFERIYGVGADNVAAWMGLCGRDSGRE